MTEVKHKVEYRKIADLEKWADNPRTITKKELEGLMQSLKEDPDYFEGRPILLSDRTGKPVIFAGNQRYEAAKALGWTEVPTVLYHCQTEEEEIRRAMRDNHNNGEWDVDMIANKFSDYPLDEWLGSDWDHIADQFDFDDEEIIEDTPPEIIEDEPPVSEMGKIYQLGKHLVMCGDSTNPADVLLLMDGNTADMIMTDPPYNVNVSNSQGMTIENDNMSSDAFNDFLHSAFENMSNALKPGGPFYIWYGDSEDVTFRTAAKDNNLVVKQCLIWVKDTFNLGRQDYQWQHEPCLYGWKDGAGHYFTDDRSLATIIDDRQDVNKMSKGELLSIVKKLMKNGVKTTVIDCEKPTANKDHPTMKPVKMIAELIRNSSKPGEKVLDSFGGSGSTMIACEQLGRQSFTMEYDPKYCDVIRKRYWTFVHGTEDGWQEGTPEYDGNGTDRAD